MTDFERINGPRAEKILKMLETIETSARSNKAEDQLGQLLAPVAERLAAIGAMSSAPEPTAERDDDATTGLTAGQRAALALADSASLRELCAALIGRLDAHTARLEGSE